jgi:hypothetical protein
MTQLSREWVTSWLFQGMDRLGISSRGGLSQRGQRFDLGSVDYVPDLAGRRVCGSFPLTTAALIVLK